MAVGDHDQQIRQSKRTLKDDCGALEAAGKAGGERNNAVGR